MLPFLKDRHESSMSGSVDETKRLGSDEEEEYGMLDAIAEDLIEAIHKKDKKLCREALGALCEHIADEDEIQDEEEHE